MADALTDFMSLDQLQAELTRLRGRKVSTRTIRRWIQKDGLPVIQEGQLRTFRPSAVRAWLERRERGGLRPPRRRRS